MTEPADYWQPQPPRYTVPTVGQRQLNQYQRPSLLRLKDGQLEIVIADSSDRLRIRERAGKVASHGCTPSQLTAPNKLARRRQSSLRCPERLSDGVDNVDLAGYKVKVTTDSLDDLAWALLTWFDENTPRFDGTVRLPWRTQRFEAVFRQDLEAVLLASVDVGAWQRLIHRLIEPLQAPATVKEVTPVDWGSVLPAEDAASPIFRQIRQKLSAVLPDVALPGQPTELSSQEVAEKITRALRDTLSRESAESGESLIDILRQPKRDAATTAEKRGLARERMVKRRYRVRLFILLLGVVIFAMSVYSIFDQTSWLTPSAIWFSWFGFWVLVATFVVQGHMNGRKQ